MFHPVGHQPQSVYWRRRIALVASVVVLLVLLVLTVNAVRGGGASGQSTPAAGPGTHSASTTAPRSAEPTTRSSIEPAPKSSSKASTASPTSTKGSAKASTSSASPSGSASSTARATACTPKQLAVRAVVAASSYQVGQKPLLELQVTDTASVPCIQNLADSQIVLKVYNGESRVWGSHDCRIEHGTMLRTLTPGTPVRVAVEWSGYSSQPGCSGTRQRVGAGSYTLYALLSGHSGAAAQFSIV